MYITVEAGDGAGKTTLSKAFAEMHGWHWAYEPDGSTELTKLFRTTALDKKYEEQFEGNMGREYLMLANRSVSLNNIKKILDTGKHVICDRSFISGMVYARTSQQMRPDLYPNPISYGEWWEIAQNAITILPQFILYVEVDTNKINKRDGDIYDHAPDEFHQKIKTNFEEALNWVKYQEIEVIRFKNDFTVSVAENVSRLTELLKNRDILK